MKSYSIKTGDKFGAWVVIGDPVRKKLGEGRGANYPLYYPCRCECGTERLVRAFKLLGNSKSCGCMKAAKISAFQTIHGCNSRKRGKHPLYSVWDGMNQRCNNPNHQYYPVYGGRGIRICQEWRDFKAFFAWASMEYSRGLQIDRIDNDGNYSPENCRWVTDAKNKRNTRKNVVIEAFGISKCVTDWALDPRCEVTPSTIVRRLKIGWSPVKAITHPRSCQKPARRFAGHTRSRP